jgi:hypothetical protein
MNSRDNDHGIKQVREAKKDSKGTQRQGSAGEGAEKTTAGEPADSAAPQVERRLNTMIGICRW